MLILRKKSNLLFPTIVTLIPIPIMVSILISISVSVSITTTFRSVQYQRHIFETPFVVAALQFGKHITLQQTGTDDKQGAVCPFLDNLRIGYNFYRRTVNEDVVVGCAKCFQKGSKAGFGKQFRRTINSARLSVCCPK